MSSDIIKQNFELRQENLKLKKENAELKKEVKRLSNALSYVFAHGIPPVINKNSLNHL